MEMGQWVKWVTILDGSRGSWVIASDRLTHDDEITAQLLAINFVVLG